MYKTCIVILGIVAFTVTGCSSKKVTMSLTGSKTIETVSDASAFSESQAKAWTGYYTAIASPPIIATVTQPDGTVVTINSQIPPPTPVIKQHQNQYIKPLTGVLKTGINIIGGGLVVREIVNAMQGTNITNTGSGTVTLDRSELVNVETTHLEGDGSIIKDSSIDESIDNTADPTIVTETIVTEKETVTVVEPEVVIVEPSYPPTTEGDVEDE